MGVDLVTLAYVNTEYNVHATIIYIIKNTWTNLKYLYKIYRPYMLNISKSVVWAFYLHHWINKGLIVSCGYLMYVKAFAK